MKIRIYYDNQANHKAGNGYMSKVIDTTELNDFKKELNKTKSYIVAREII